jgi:hypothetical protein
VIARAVAAAALLGALLGAHCQKHDDSARALDRALDALDDGQPVKQTLRELDRSLAGASAALQQEIASLARGSAEILMAEPDCRAWVEDYLYERLVELRHGVSTKKGRRVSVVCPIRPEEVDVSESSRVRLYAFPGAETRIRATLHLADGFIVSFSRPDRDEAGAYFETGGVMESHCGDAALLVQIEGQTPFTIKILAKRQPDSACVQQALDVEAASKAYCNEPCCEVDTIQSCQTSICDRMCNEARAAGVSDEVIKDACEAGGALHTYCQSYCNGLKECHADWCGDDAPQRDACHEYAAQEREAAIEECPQLLACTPAAS